MKRLLLLLLSFPTVLAAQTPSDAVCPTESRDSLQRLDTTGGDLMTLRGDDREGSVVVEVAGFGLTLGHAPEPQPYADRVMKGGKIRLYVFNSCEFGFTTLTGVDYAGYAPEQHGFLDLEREASLHVAASAIQVEIALNRRRTLFFATDLHVAIDNFRLSDPGIRLSYENGRIVPVALGAAADKSKFVASSLGIPLRLNYRPFRHFQLSAIAYSDFSVELAAVHKNPRVEYDLEGLRTYRFGVGASVSYYGFGLYARYGVTPLFRKDAGPACHTLSFGITVLM